MMNGLLAENAPKITRNSNICYNYRLIPIVVLDLLLLKAYVITISFASCRRRLGVLELLMLFEIKFDELRYEGKFG